LTGVQPCALPIYDVLPDELAERPDVVARDLPVVRDDLQRQRDGRVARLAPAVPPDVVPYQVLVERLEHPLDLPRKILQVRQIPELVKQDRVPPRSPKSPVRGHSR